ncbi:arylsulfatase J-like [Saccoglossus kowalevskii]|uniref:Arylsulfatase J-like n=1 Tax=Saccoglossus kowalevskii TaxID=10224 RepID=A0ABM0MH31_SACKO|nr:PREDICTED: arylsulfatase J-like [Saccoglossus kowalevskii]
MASCVDETIANIIKALDNKGMLKNTVNVFTTDNGAGRYGSNWPLRGGKKSHWEGGVRAVGFVYSDLLPMVGKELSARGDVLIGLDPTEKAGKKYRTGPFKDDKFDITIYAAIKMSKWKLLAGNNGPRNSWNMADPVGGQTRDLDFDETRMVRLYDLVDDPSERTDVSEEKQEIVHKMLAKLDEYAKKAVPPQM